MNAVVQSNVDVNSFAGFSIDSSSVAAFRVLSDTLYSNKIGSMVREVCRNAADAHDAAGIPNEPIEITLPTSMNPHFIVKDHGIGLSEEDIDTIYRHYFRSTKDNSFGLGAKSPFAVADSFNVTTVKNGMKYSYTATMDENGFPYMVKMGEISTTEPNGVEVDIPIKREDLYKISDEVFQQCAYFDTFPIVNGSNKVFRDWKKEIWKQIGPIGFTNSQNNAVVIIVKKVGYVINNDTIGQHLTKGEKDFFRILKGTYWFLPEIETTPSREDISFSQKTINIIKKLLHDNYNEVKSMMVQEFNAISNKFEKFMWILNHDHIARTFDLTVKDTASFKFETTLNCMVPDTKYDNIVTAVCYSRDWSSAVSRDVVRDNHIILTKDFKIVLSDTSKQSVSKIRYWLKEVSNGSGQPSKVLYYKVKDLKKFYKDLDCPNPEKYFTMLSDLPTPPKSNRSYNREKVEAWQIRSSWFNSKSNTERVYEELDTLEGYYVTVDNMQANQSVNSKYWDFYRNHDDSGLSVYAIREKDEQKVIEAGNMIPFDQAMETKINQKITSTLIVKASILQLDSFHEEILSKISEKFIDKDVTLLKKISKRKEIISKNDSEIYNFISRYILSGNKPFKKIKRKYDKLTGEVEARYPLAFPYYGAPSDKVSEVVFYMKAKAEALANNGKV